MSWTASDTVLISPNSTTHKIDRFYKGSLGNFLPFISLLLLAAVAVAALTYSTYIYLY